VSINPQVQRTVHNPEEPLFVNRLLWEHAILLKDKCFSVLRNWLPKIVIVDVKSAYLLQGYRNCVFFVYISPYAKLCKN